MKLTVTTVKGGVEVFENAMPQLKEGGVLLVQGDGKQTYFGPAFWARADLDSSDDVVGDDVH
jgi:hypothetical protein